MSRGSRRTRRLFVLGLSGLVSLVGVAALAPNASAAHHFVRVREVFAGPAANANSEFVELQLTVAFENQLFNQTSIRFFGPTGVEGAPAAFSADPTNGQNQRTVLVASAAAQTQFGVTADLPFADSNRLDPAGGAVCFNSAFFAATPPTGPGIDCVSWGNFTGGAMLPTNANAAAGTPEPGTIPDGSSIDRIITANDPAFFEPNDDTNNSTNDFAQDPAPSPCPNSAPATGGACDPGGVAPPPLGGGSTPQVTPTPAKKKKKCKKKAKKGVASAKKCKRKKK
jgi:hypothetical protein